MLSLLAAKFKTRATQLTADLGHRAKIRAALKSYEKARDERKAQFQDWEAARTGVQLSSTWTVPTSCSPEVPMSPRCQSSSKSFSK